MQLSQLFETGRCPFALEVFPPKRESGVESIYNMLQQLHEIPVDYISVTYSAGGSGAREYTAQIARHLKQELGVEPLAHLTCTNSRRDEVGREMEALRAGGVENVLALRGDAIPGAERCHDFAHASDLMREVNAFGGFYLVGACYPEGHPESQNLAQDVERLRFKLDSGAGHLVSQLFFDNGKFFRFLNLARKKGLDCPVEAGVMPVVKPEQITRTISLSSASLPSEFTKWVSRYSDDRASFYAAGVDYSIRQIRDLIEGGVDGIHLYAMNNPDVAKAIYDGVRDLL